MTTKFAQDIGKMHARFGVYDVVDHMTEEERTKLLDFRLSMLKEEFNETLEAHANKDAEELVDGLTDLVVIAIGTLDLFDVDATVAWNRVMDANMAKVVGVKPERENPLGLPDLIKPVGWEAPSHVDNHGLLTHVYD